MLSSTRLFTARSSLRAGVNRRLQHGFITELGSTISRVFGGVLLAAAIGSPLGMLMGAYKPVEAFFEPFISFSR